MNRWSHLSADNTNYAIGAGKTTSSNNLKATVSGGKMLITGMSNRYDKERIEYRCSATGKITKLSPTNKPLKEPEIHYYHKFRQQNKSNLKSHNEYSSPKKNLQKNKFPLPFTGVEYPLIDGGGITSSGREGIYADNK